jgi:MFS family permease
MRLSYKLIVFINWFGTGLLVPVLSLLLLSRGCTPVTLGAVIGVYSAAVITAEVPTGIFADLRGRKNALLLSCAAYAVSFSLILLSGHFVILLAAMIFQGAGRAFASGSIDALIIEDTVARRGEAAVAGAVSGLAVLQGIGVASGALAGGLLPNLRGYALHLAARITLLAAVFILTAVCIKEQRRAPEAHVTLKTHLAMSRRLLAGNKLLRYILLCIAAASVMMFTVETYWQPAFKALKDAHEQIFLGLLSAAGFAATTLGSFLAGKLPFKTHRSRWIVYLVLLSGMAVSLALIAFQRFAVGFSALFILWYALLGIVNVPEQTLLNLAVPDALRASLLSTASLSCQLGGVFSGLLCSLVIAGAGLTGIWLVGPGLTLCAVLTAALMNRYGHDQCKTPAETPPAQ